MARLAGIDLPKNKKVLYGLQYIYGIGEFTAATILEKAKVSPDKKVVDLTEEEVAEIEYAMEIAYQMHTTAMRMAKPGVIERDIAGAIEGIALSVGNGVSFTPIVSKNGQILHNHYYGNVLKEGDLI